MAFQKTFGRKSRTREDVNQVIYKEGKQIRSITKETGACISNFRIRAWKLGIICINLQKKSDQITQFKIHSVVDNNEENSLLKKPRWPNILQTLMKHKNSYQHLWELLSCKYVSVDHSLDVKCLVLFFACYLFYSSFNRSQWQILIRSFW